MQVHKYIIDTLASKKMHMTLIDPDEQSPEEAAKIAGIAEEIGTDSIMIGGSTGVTQDILDKTVIRIKERVGIPVILFPTTAKAISQYADAIYFMSLLNSNNPKFIIREQKTAAPFLSRMDIDIISMGYILVEPGMKVGEVGEAELVCHEDMEGAIGYAKAGEMLGMKLIYLEAGSGADRPVPPAMVKCVKDSLHIPLIVGGGIREKEAARDAALAGADIIVTGTLVEQDGWKEKLSEIVTAINQHI